MREVIADLASDRYERAIETCRRRIRESGDDLFWSHHLGVALYKRGRFEEASLAFAVAIEREPRSARSVYGMGLVLKDLGRREEALAKFEEAYRLDATFVAARVQAGFVRRALGRFEEARVDLEEALAGVEPRDNMLERLAAIRLELGDREGALAAFVRAARRGVLGPDRLALLAREIGKLEDSRAAVSYGKRMKGVLGSIGDGLRTLGARLEDAASDAGSREALEEIQAAHRRVYHDLVAFLAAMEHESLSFDMASPRDLVTNALFVAAEATAKCRVEVDVPGTLPEIVCDPKRVQEALLNVILNAADATGGEGELSISARSSAEDEVAFRIVDTGEGIDVSRLPRLFEFGYTTRPFGSGLGLWQARRLVELHGGQIAVSSVAGGPTEIEIRLPVRPRKGPGRPPAEARPSLEEPIEDLLLGLP